VPVLGMVIVNEPKACHRFVSPAKVGGSLPEDLQIDLLLAAFLRKGPRANYSRGWAGSMR
jgi:hypothetical protein